VYLLARDECVVSKAGKKTYGLPLFFLVQQVDARVGFFRLVSD